MNSEKENELEKVDDGKYEIEVTGYSCPYPEVFARRSLENLESGDELILFTDNKPSSERVPDSLEEDGHEIIRVTKEEEALWKIVIKKG